MTKRIKKSVALVIILAFISNLPFASLLVNAKNDNQVSSGDASESSDEASSDNEEADDTENIIDYENLKINYNADYNQVLYGSEDGIRSIEVNAIAQTPDGYIYVGSYAGLYRYDGTTFKSLKLDADIANVICMFVDDTGKLWIGTNDKGIVVYNPQTTEVVRYTTENGLASNSIRCIVEDQNKNFYVGTSSYLCRISGDGQVTSYSNLSDITFVKKMIMSYEDILYGVTNEGGIFALKNGSLVNGGYFVNKDYTVNCLEQRGSKLIMGTIYGDILSCDKSDITNWEVFASSDDIEGLANINKLLCDDKGGFFIGADNGFGYYDINGIFQNFRSEGFQGSVSDILIDYQDNVWFSSSKYGVCKLAYNPFSDVFKLVGLGSNPVNAITGKDGLLYIATDNGLIIIDEKNKKLTENDNLAFLNEMRIRDAYKDSKGNIWFSVYDTEGIVKLSNDGSVIRLGEAEGALGAKYRSTIELPDGTIAEASNLGITFIKDDKVIAAIGENDGMTVPQILCMELNDSGELLAGSDGDGIYVIKNNKVVRRIGEEDGLGALVVLRIVKAKGGFIYVGSDSLYYDDGNTITKLDAFPYTNNYDVYIGNNDEAWVSSSAGLFLVNTSELIANGDYDYVLLDKYNGFDTTLVANSWNYKDNAGNIYLCCSTGIKKFNVNEYGKVNGDYNIYINEVDCDDVVSVLPVGTESITIPPGVNRVSFSLSVLNYSLSNPLVRVSLEGFDDAGVVMRQSELSEISFTNIPNGNYILHIQILDEVDRSITKEISVEVIKEAEFYEKKIFKTYLWIVICALLFFTAWLLAKYGSVNELKYQYNETRKAKDEAEKANQAKSQFLANMSHEIRTPINAILGMNELLMQENINEAVQGYAKDIKSATTSLLSMVNDVLDFSKMESQKMHIVEQEYSSKHLIDNVVAILLANSKSKGLKAVCNIDSNIPAKLLGDEGRIRQILLNLVSNAIKYTREGQVDFSVNVTKREEEFAFIKFSVKDTGIGIRKADMPKLFESFERVDEEINANIQGTGLGLPITKELAGLMGTEICVESEYGKGSEFYFVLKQKVLSEDTIGIYEKDNAKGTVKKRQTLFTAKGAKILVVDDNAINRKVVKGILKGTECNIEQAESGMKCIELAEANHYDVILLDHMMPEMDGIETIERLKNSEAFDKTTPIIALTANATEGAREKYIELGFSDYITKPVKPEELEELLLKYLPKILVTRNDKN